MKKLLKKQEPQPLQLSDSDSDELPIRGGNAFSFLLADQSNSDLDEHEVQEEQENVGKASHIAIPQRKVKKSKPKAEDDLDTVIQEIQEQYKDTDTPVASRSLQTRDSILGVDLRNLDGDAELRRMFGKAATTESKRIVGRRSTLAKPKADWPRMEKLGIDMEMLHRSEESIQFKFVHSERYRQMEEKMVQMASTFDPGAIAALLQIYPYHLNTLFTMSEIFKASGDMQHASGFIERALYANESSFDSLFITATGKCRLAYKYYENRNFHLSVFRHIQYQARKACWKTAFEFAKLLFALEPEEDALGMSLLIDFYAHKAGEYNWLLQFLDAFPLDSPNIAYGRALAMHHLGKKEATQALFDAMKRWPAIVPRLFEACGATHSKLAKMPKEEDGMSVMLDLIVERNHILWKEADTIEWLRETLSQFDLKMEPETFTVALNHWRGISMCDVERITSRVPGYLTRGGLWQHDPLPPLDGVTYLSTRAPIEDMGMIEALFRSLVPSFGQAGQVARNQVPAGEPAGEARGPVEMPLDRATLLQFVRGLGLFRRREEAVEESD